MGRVVTVSGAVGGIGTSTLAYTIALQGGEPAVLIDAQPDGVPLDVLVGSEAVPGARWGQVRVQSDAIEGTTVLAALPQFVGLHILSADRAGTADARALRFIVDALRACCELVVVDIPAREAVIEQLRADLRLLVVPPTVTGLGAALAVPDPGLVVAVDIGRADFPISSMGDYLGEVAGIIRWQRGVALAGSRCEPPPGSSDVARVAGFIWQRLHDGL